MKQQGFSKVSYKHYILTDPGIRNSIFTLRLSSPVGSESRRLFNCYQLPQTLAPWVGGVRQVNVRSGLSAGRCWEMRNLRNNYITSQLWRLGLI